MKQGLGHNHNPATQRKSRTEVRALDLSGDYASLVTVGEVDVAFRGVDQLIRSGERPKVVDHAYSRKRMCDGIF